MKELYSLIAGYRRAALIRQAGKHYTEHTDPGVSVAASNADMKRRLKRHRNMVNLERQMISRLDLTLTRVVSTPNQRYQDQPSFRAYRRGVMNEAMAILADFDRAAVDRVNVILAEANRGFVNLRDATTAADEAMRGFAEAGIERVVELRADTGRPTDDHDYG